MKNEKIVGYLCVAAVTIAVVVVTKDALITFGLALCGFYVISGFEEG